MNADTTLVACVLTSVKTLQDPTSAAARWASSSPVMAGAVTVNDLNITSVPFFCLSHWLQEHLSAVGLLFCQKNTSE